MQIDEFLEKPEACRLTQEDTLPTFVTLAIWIRALCPDNGHYCGTTMNNRIKAILALGSLAAAGWFYYTPYLAVQGMKQAAQQADSVALSSYIDYPALKSSLKAELKGRMLPQTGKDKPFAALGIALADPLINSMVDGIVSPQGLSLLLQGKRQLKQLGDSERAPDSEETAKQPPDTGKPPAASMGYEGFNQFVIQSGEPGATTDFILQRKGLVSWQLIEIRLAQ
jgi:hypothetical protein